MQELILLKLGELVLKGLNRHTFEERLCGNIRRRIRNHCRIHSRYCRIRHSSTGEG